MSHGEQGDHYGTAKAAWAPVWGGGNPREDQVRLHPPCWWGAACAGCTCTRSYRLLSSGGLARRGEVCLSAGPGASWQGDLCLSAGPEASAAPLGTAQLGLCRARAVPCPLPSSAAGRKTNPPQLCGRKETEFIGNQWHSLHQRICEKCLLYFLHSPRWKWSRNPTWEGFLGGRWENQKPWMKSNIQAIRP